MSFEIVKGDLFHPAFNFDGICQGVNTLGVMGAGIAVVFRETWPSMYDEYRRNCKRFGAALGGSLHTWQDPESGLIIFNLFSQIDPGDDGRYALLRRAAVQLVLEAEARNHSRVGLPWIGCGIAGLAKHNVEDILHEVFNDSQVEFVLVEQ